MKINKNYINYSNKLIKNREKIYDNLKNLRLVNKKNVLFTSKIIYHNEINYLTNLYLAENIKYHFNKKYSGLNRSINLIKRLPNLTPNGILKVRKETQLIYNLITKFLFKSLEDLSIKFATAAYPVIRIKTGESNSKRPYSTSKLHSDSWVGQYGDAIASFGVEGDFKKNTVKFYAPSKVSHDFFKKIDDYTLGLKKFTGLEYIAKLNKGYFIIFDHCVLHKTVTEKNCNPRISIDFGVKFDSSVKRSVKNGDIKRWEYVRFEKYKYIGAKSLIISSDLVDYKKNSKKFINI